MHVHVQIQGAVCHAAGARLDRLEIEREVALRHRRAPGGQDARGLAGAERGGGAAPASQGSSATFLAFASDFRSYHSWQRYDVTDDAALAGIHDGSTVTEYVNSLPPHGSKAFPVGTIIVKEATGGTIPHELFAAVNASPP